MIKTYFLSTNIYDIEVLSKAAYMKDRSKLITAMEALETPTDLEVQYDAVRKALNKMAGSELLTVSEKALDTVMYDLEVYVEKNSLLKYRPRYDEAARLFLSMMNRICANIGNFRAEEFYGEDTTNIGWIPGVPEDRGGNASFISQPSLLKFGIAMGYLTKESESWHFYEGCSMNRCARYKVNDKWFSLLKGKFISIARSEKDVNRTVRKIAMLSNKEIVRLGSCLTVSITSKLSRVINERIKAQQCITIPVGELSGMTDKEWYDKRTAELNEEVGIELAQARVLSRIKAHDFSYTVDSMRRDNFGGRTYDILSQVAGKYRGSLRVETATGQKKIVEIDASEMGIYLAVSNFIKQEGLTTDHKNFVQELLTLASGNIRGFMAINIGESNFYVNEEVGNISFSMIDTLKDYQENKEAVKKFMLLGHYCKKGCPAGELFDRAIAYTFPGLKGLRGYFHDRREAMVKGSASRNALAGQRDETLFMQGTLLSHNFAELISPELDPTDIKSYKSSLQDFDDKGMLPNLMKKGCSWLKMNHDSVWVKEGDEGKVIEAFREAAAQFGYYVAPALKIDRFGKKACKLRYNQLVKDIEIFELDRNKLQGKSELGKGIGEEVNYGLSVNQCKLPRR